MLSKSELRNEARGRRVRLASALPDFAQRIAAHGPALPARSIIGGYVALPGEADPHLLLQHYARGGHTIAFPRVAAKAAPLSFHLWQEGQLLAPGAFGIPEPSPDWRLANPDVLLVPLLAFDAQGHRLGYGGGYYDRTLAALREKGQITAIGIAFSGQRIDKLPRDPNDERLDMIVTELGIERFG